MKQKLQRRLDVVLHDFNLDTLEKSWRFFAEFEDKSGYLVTGDTDKAQKTDPRCKNQDSQKE